ncbi:hypothetical protein D3C76_1515490 [compost metagenome]
MQRIAADTVLVIVDQIAFSNTPQFATTIVVVNFCQLPGVFIEIQIAFGVDVSLPRLQSRLDMPDPMQLIARQVLIDMSGLEYVSVFDVW